VAVPKLGDLREKAALAALKKAGLQASVVTGPSPKVKKGKVLLQSPAGGVMVARDSTVVVVVSGGKPADKASVTLPDLQGHAVADATSALQSLGLVVKITPENAAGPVSAQVPAAGNVVSKGSVVILTITPQ
jgi:serine/threonine-protein kinase